MSHRMGNKTFRVEVSYCNTASSTTSWLGVNCHFGIHILLCTQQSISLALEWPGWDHSYELTHCQFWPQLFKISFQPPLLWCTLKSHYWYILGSFHFSWFVIGIYTCYFASLGIGFRTSVDTRISGCSRLVCRIALGLDTTHTFSLHSLSHPQVSYST